MSTALEVLHVWSKREGVIKTVLPDLHADGYRGVVADPAARGRQVDPRGARPSQSGHGRGDKPAEWVWGHEGPVTAKVTDLGGTPAIIGALLNGQTPLGSWSWLPSTRFSSRGLDTI